jgi:hypothetical protein
MNNMKDTLQKGLVAEMKLQTLLIEEGFSIFMPIGIKRYDLLLEINNKFYKIQCKNAHYDKYGSLVFNAYSIQFSEIGKRNKRRLYTKQDIDFMVGYYDDKFYCIPIEEVKTNVITLRLEEARMKNRKYKFAKDYNLLDVLKKYY